MTLTRTSPPAIWPELLRVEEAATLLRVSKGVVYGMAKSGQLASVRCGRLLRIPKSALVAMTAGTVAGPFKDTQRVPVADLGAVLGDGVTR